MRFKGLFRDIVIGLLAVVIGIFIGLRGDRELLGSDTVFLTLSLIIIALAGEISWSRRGVFLLWFSAHLAAAWLTYALL